jgi:murein DD-endopeptidase MepM/ murein hydrolase activator NlpD
MLAAGQKRTRHTTHRSASEQIPPAPSKKPRTLIHQNKVGEVVIDRVDVIGLEALAPAPHAERFDYPQPVCEPTDTVVEVRLHDTEAGNPDTLEVETEAISQEVARSTVSPRSTVSKKFSRIASKLGSFFRPKSSEARVRPEDVDLETLLSQGLLIPVEGVNAAKLQDSFLSSRGRHTQHLAIDIGAPRGTPVLATTDGQIVRVGREQRGGNSIYQKDASGQYLLFYCHLSRYAAKARPGQQVHKGDVIGYVGATGHVIGGPHLHFSITRLPENSANFRAGMAINPYLLFLGGVR